MKKDKNLSPINELLSDLNLGHGETNHEDDYIQSEYLPSNTVLERSFETNAFSEDVSGVSAYDINLAEFPITHLSTRLPAGTDRQRISFSDSIIGRKGERIKRSWEVSTASKYGLGGPSTLPVLYEIFQIWKEQGFKDKTINLGTYYSFLKRLGKTDGALNYRNLKRDFDCLVNLRISAKMARYIPENDEYIKEENFSLFPHLKIYGKDKNDADVENDYIYLTVDEDFYQSVQQKTIFHIPFSKELFSSLKPSERKLALYLSKIFNPASTKKRTEWNRNIFVLADQLPINARYIQKRIKRKLVYDKMGNIVLQKDPKIIKTVLHRVSKTLMKLDDFPYLTNYKIKGDTITFFNEQTELPLQSQNSQDKDRNIDRVRYLANEMLNVCKDKHSLNFYFKVAWRVPESIIFPALSEAKHEGKEPAKLFTKIIQDRASDFLNKQDSEKRNNNP